MKLVSVAKGLTMSLAAGAVLMSSAAWAETVVDAAGRTVEVPEKVERILLGKGV